MNILAFKVKTVIVVELSGMAFDTTLNKAIEDLEDAVIIDIKFTSTADKEGNAWFNALIVYREAE